MKPVALILSIGTFFYFLIALGYWDNGGQFAWISPDEVFHAITFPPLSFLAFGLFIYGLVRLVTGKSLRIYYSAVGLFALPLCSLYALDQIKAGRAEKYFGNYRFNAPLENVRVRQPNSYRLPVSRYDLMTDSIFGCTAIASSVLAPDVSRFDNHRAFRKPIAEQTCRIPDGIAGLVPVLSIEQRE